MEKGDDSSFHDSLDESDIEDDSLNIPNISFFSGKESDEVHRDFEDDDSENHLETITEEQESGEGFFEILFLVDFMGFLL